jgi:hypothetical protein
VIPGSGWRKSGPLPPGLLAELESELPVPLDAVHAVGVPDAGGTLLVCACPVEAFGAIPADFAALTPESIPVELASALTRPPPPARLTCRGGARAPAPARRARARRHLRRVLAGAACVLLLAAGLQRRTAALEAANASTRARIDAVLESAGAGSEDELASRVELHRALAGAVDRAGVRADAAPTLAALLAAWPAIDGVTPQSISADAGTLSLELTTVGDPAGVLAALTPPPGWRAEEPRLTAVGEGRTRIGLRLVRAASEGGTP